MKFRLICIAFSSVILFTTFAQIPRLMAAGGTLRMDKVTKHQREAYARQRVEKRRADASRENHIRMEGQLRYSASRGLSLEGTPLVLTGQTTFYPSRDGVLFPDPKRLNGRKVSVFGVRTSNGVEAAIILDRSDAALGQAGSLWTTDDAMKPSASDSRVGEYPIDSGS